MKSLSNAVYGGTTVRWVVKLNLKLLRVLVVSYIWRFSFICVLLSSYSVMCRGLSGQKEVQGKTLYLPQLFIGLEDATNTRVPSEWCHGYSCLSYYIPAIRKSDEKILNNRLSATALERILANKEGIC